MTRALILTYHAVEAGPAPLCVDRELFRAHLDCVIASGARTVTISELREALVTGTLSGLMVAITFDDGFASVVETAAPLLVERGLTATVFCVAGHTGGWNDWPSGHPGGFRGRLADTSQLAHLASHGFEIGSHGMEHEPLVGHGEAVLRREVVDSRLALEQAVHAPVRSFAYPYGAGPSPLARRLVEETYAAACGTTLGPVATGADLHALPRIEIHYVRRTELLQRALLGSFDGYLRARGLGAKARRVLRKDYVALAPDRFGREIPS